MSKTKDNKKEPAKNKQGSERTTLESLLASPTRELINNEEQLIDYNRSNDSKILMRLLQREDEEMILRKYICGGLFLILAIQVLAVNFIIMGIGLNELVFNDYEPLRWLFVFVIAEVVTLISLIVKYLFGKGTTENLKLIGKYIDRMTGETSTNEINNDEDEPFEYQEEI